MGLGPRVKVQGYRVILIVFEVNLYFVFFGVGQGSLPSTWDSGTLGRYQDIDILISLQSMIIFQANMESIRNSNGGV